MIKNNKIILGALAGAMALNLTGMCAVYAEENTSQNLVIENGVLKDGKTAKGDIVIPDTVTEIGPNAFSRNTDIKSVVIPDSVKTIDGDAFFRCSELNKVIMGDNVTEVGKAAFAFCGLTEVKLSKNLKVIDDGGFNSCFSLKKIEIPESITSIGKSAFLKETELVASGSKSEAVIKDYLSHVYEY